MKTRACVFLATVSLALAVAGSFGQAQAVGQRRSTAKPSRTQLAAFEPQAAPAQNKQRVYSADDPHGLKVLGMPKARHKYLITDLPAGTEVPAEYSSCGNGVYYLKERVRGVDLTAVVVHFRADGDFELTADMLADAKLLRNGPRIGSYIPQGWVSFTFTFLPDAFTLQAIRVMREFPERSIFGTDLQRSSAMVKGGLVRLDRSWVDKDPYVTWEILPESQLSHLIFRIRLPKSTKECLQGKK